MANIIFKLSDVYNNEKITLPHDDSEERIIGEIILNRVVGIAYDNLDLSCLNKESKKALSILKRNHETQFDVFIKKLQYVSSILKNANFKYALLKGAFLTPALYKRGQRTSNDIDILINADDVTAVQNILLKNGFIQGHCDESGKIVPATRREVIESKMNYGETVPFLQYFDNELIEIDLNFSVDFKSKGNGNIVAELLNSAHLIKTEHAEIMTLCETDFLIHLCCHLFKEATTYDWVINRRDLMLYKFSDINVFLHNYGNGDYFEKLAERIKQFGVEKECYYTFVNSATIYPRLSSLSGFSELISSIKPDNNEYLKQIIYPKTKKVYEYNCGFENWFESQNRMSLLNEVDRKES